MPRTTRTTILPVDPASACAQLAAATTETVRGYAQKYRSNSMPASEWTSAAPFVTLALLALAPTSRANAGNVGWLVSVHVRACLARGADRTVPGVWASEQVEHTLTSKLPVADVSRASLASMLRRASRALVPAGQPPRPVVHPRSRPLGPYDTAALSALVEAVTTIASPLWRARASLLVALTAGAGITNADAALLRAGDITATDRGLLVQVPSGTRARVVPVRHEFEQLTAAAHTALVVEAAADPRVGTDQLFPGDDAASRCFGKLAWPTGLERPTTFRLRATWSALTLASGCGVPAYLRAAHITSIDSWYATVALLPELPLVDYCAQVRGTTNPFAVPDRILDGHPWPAPVMPLNTDTAPAAVRRATQRSGR